MPGGNLNKEIFLNTVKSDAANGTQSKWGVAGPRYFKYNGEWLNDIRKRLDV